MRVYRGGGGGGGGCGGVYMYVSTCTACIEVHCVPPRYNRYVHWYTRQHLLVHVPAVLVSGNHPCVCNGGGMRTLFTNHLVLPTPAHTAQGHSPTPLQHHRARLMVKRRAVRCGSMVVQNNEPGHSTCRVEHMDECIIALLRHSTRHTPWCDALFFPSEDGWVQCRDTQHQWQQD